MLHLIFIELPNTWSHTFIRVRVADFLLCPQKLEEQTVYYFHTNKIA